MRRKLLTLCALLFALPAAAEEAPRADLFRFLDGEASRDSVSLMSAVAGREILAGRRVAVDRSVLEGPFRMRLLDERDYEMEATGIERRGPADFAWRGKVVDPVLGEVGTATLTVLGDLMAGFVVTADAVYQIEPGAPGEHRLLQVENAVESCGGGVLPDVAPKSPQQRQAARIAAIAAAAEAQVARQTAGLAASVRIDLLAIWTPEARISLGGTRQMQVVVQNGVDVANSAFLNSQIDARVNLVHAREMKIPESGHADEDLNAFRQNREVAALRKSVGADLVTLFVNKMLDACGIGYLMTKDSFSHEFEPYAYTVVKRACGGLTLAHEIGHNMGAHHDRPNAGNADRALFPFAFGYTLDGQFRTVMAYGNNCTSCQWVENFSNPNVSRNGHATGVAGQTDNAQVLNATKGLTSTYQTLPLQACKKGKNNLCLLGNRFRVELFWENQFNNTQGVGTAVPRTDATGFFTFGDPSNLELMVKLLDFGDVVKVFYGQLTNLRFSLIVTDTRTGASKVYENTPRECGGIDQSAFAASSAALAVATGPSASGAKAAAGACRKDRNTLCLLKDRFAVKVDWRNPGNGTSGTGGAVPISSVTGAFWFTDAGNLELMAKVIDYGDRIDFFYGTLSDLEYTITVTDTNTGQVKTYRNAAGNFCGGQEGSAFPR